MLNEERDTSDKALEKKLAEFYRRIKRNDPENNELPEGFAEMNDMLEAFVQSGNGCSFYDKYVDEDSIYYIFTVHTVYKTAVRIIAVPKRKLIHFEITIPAAVKNEENLPELYRVINELNSEICSNLFEALGSYSYSPQTNRITYNYCCKLAEPNADELNKIFKIVSANALLLSNIKKFENVFESKDDKENDT